MLRNQGIQAKTQKEKEDMNKDLMALFRRDSAVIMMTGRKDYGKTDFSLRLGEDAYEEGLIQRIGSNIRTKDERSDHITNLHSLKTWLNQKGRKYFVFDEAGKHLARTRFMAQLNKVIMDIIQLVRHYNATFTAIAPSERFIDSKFLGSEILDCRIKKLNRKTAEVRNYLSFRAYLITQIPRTTVKFWSKDIADFTMESERDLTQLADYERVAYLYGHGLSMDQIGQELEPKKHRYAVSRMLRKYLSIHFSELSKVTSY